MPSLKAGQELFNRRYELLRPLGAGGMGVVWLARDRTEQAQVALKFLPTVLVLQDSEMRRLREEVRAGKELRHPRLVATYALEVEGAIAAIAMEYVDGRTLKEMLEAQERGFFEVEEISGWLRDVCAALAYLHEEAKRIHRDIKPANIIIDTHGRARLMDFGISHRVQESVTRHSKTGEGSTASSSTLAYASPQQLSGKPAHASDDLYSLGATCYELLTGTPPFFRGGAEMVAMQIKTEPATPLIERRAELVSEGLHRHAGAVVPPPWEKVVALCLAKEREKRPQTCAQVLASLEEQRAENGQPGQEVCAYASLPTSVLEELKQRCPRLVALPVSPAGNWAERMRESVDVQRCLGQIHPCRDVISSATLAAGAIYANQRDLDGVLVCFEVRQQEVIGSIVEVGDGAIDERFTHAIPISQVMPGSLWSSLSQAWKAHECLTEPVPTPAFHAVVPAVPALAIHADVLQQGLPGQKLVWKDSLPAALGGALTQSQICDGQEKELLYLFALYRSLLIQAPTGDTFQAFPAFATLPMRKTFQTKCSASAWGGGEFHLLEDAPRPEERLKLQTLRFPHDLTTREGERLCASLMLEVDARGCMHLTAEARSADKTPTSPPPEPPTKPPAPPPTPAPAFIPDKAPPPPAAEKKDDSLERNWPFTLMCLALMGGMGWIRQMDKHGGALDYVVLSILAGALLFAVLAWLKVRGK